MAEDWSKSHIRATSEKDYKSPIRRGRRVLTEVQAEAILNMRLRSLRRLEEMELNAERDALMKERADLADLLDSDRRQWKRIGKDLDEVRKLYGKGTDAWARAGRSLPTRPRSRTSPTRR